MIFFSHPEFGGGEHVHLILETLSSLLLWDYSPLCCVFGLSVLFFQAADVLNAINQQGAVLHQESYTQGLIKKKKKLTSGWEQTKHTFTLLHIRESCWVAHGPLQNGVNHMTMTTAQKTQLQSR